MWVDEANVIRALVALRLSVAGAFFIVFQLRMLILEKGTPVLAICPTDYTYNVDIRKGNTGIGHLPH